MKESSYSKSDNANLFLYVENLCTPKMCEIGQVLSEEKMRRKKKKNNNSSEP
jgi:hypothetical protein